MFSPSLLAPLVPLLATAGTLVIPFDLILGWRHLGEHLNVTGLISASGITVAAWVRLFQRQEIWNGLQEWIKEEGLNAKIPSWGEKEIAYLYDYFHITRTLRERKMDRAIEVAEVKPHDIGTEGIDFNDAEERVSAITTFQKEQRKENFVKESFPELHEGDSFDLRP